MNTQDARMNTEAARLRQRMQEMTRERRSATRQRAHTGGRPIDRATFERLIASGRLDRNSVAARMMARSLGLPAPADDTRKARREVAVMP